MTYAEQIKLAQVFLKLRDVIRLNRPRTAMEICDVAIEEFRKRKFPPRRRQWIGVGQCKVCDRELARVFMPPHDASPNCESGGRNHCTCSICFD